MWNYEDNTVAIEPVLNRALLTKLSLILSKLDLDRLNYIYEKAIYQLEEQQWLTEDC